MKNRNDIKSDYLKLLFGIEPLTTQEEHSLAGLIAQGDEDALEKLIRHNLRFVVLVVSGMTAWRHGKVPQEDMIAMGNESMLKAAMQWKPTNNAKFVTYAKSFIFKDVRRDLDNTADIIRLPVNIKEAIKKMSYNERALSQVIGRKPTVTELATIMNTTPAKIYQLRAHINREPVSLDNLNSENPKEESEE